MQRQCTPKPKTVRLGPCHGSHDSDGLCFAVLLGHLKSKPRLLWIFHRLIRSVLFIEVLNEADGGPVTWDDVEVNVGPAGESASNTIDEYLTGEVIPHIGLASHFFIDLLQPLDNIHEHGKLFVPNP